MTQEALKLALEALEEWAWTAHPRPKTLAAIAAIKEALAQPQQEPAYRAVKTFHEGKPVYVAQPQQEPFAFEPNDADLLEAFTRSNNGPNPFYRCNICGDTEPGVREYLVAHWLKHNTSPPQRTEQEQQIETLKRCLFQMQEAAKDLVEQAKSLPLPQRTWVGLTLDEIDAFEKGSLNRQALCCAIESKLKEKNT